MSVRNSDGSVNSCLQKIHNRKQFLATLNITSVQNSDNLLTPNLRNFFLITQEITQKFAIFSLKIMIIRKMVIHRCHGLRI